MALINYKPTSPGRRGMSASDFSQISKSEPEKSLTKAFKKSGGRNSAGRITAKYRGGGHKKRYRLIDFKRRSKEGVPALVKGIEYDPNRSTRIALLQYSDGEKRYILAPNGLKVGNKLMAGANAEIQQGNALELKDIPLGTALHNIELRPGKGGQLARGAGAVCQLVAKEGKYVSLRLPSGEVRKVLNTCYATIGQLGNLNHENVTIGKAGRKRWLGIKPRTRPVAMNPVDHPMGGGEGRSSGGRHPCSPKGIPAKGYKTRKNKRSGKFIVSRHKK